MPLSASALRAAFRRSGAAGEHVCEIEDAPPDIVAAVRNALAGLHDPDLPVLISWESAGDWVAIAPTELIVSRVGRLARLSASDISEVLPAVGQRLQKTEMTELEVVFSTGETLRIRGDRGQAFSGLWNALTALARAKQAR